MALELSDAGLLRTEAYINGEWVSADDGARLDVLNPATGEVITSVAKVVRPRRVVLSMPQKLPWPNGAKCQQKSDAGHLRNWFNIIMAHQEDLARLMTVEQGKVIAEARGEVAYGASYIEWFAEQAKRIDGDVIPAPSADKRVVCLKQPVGVCAAITP